MQKKRDDHAAAQLELKVRAGHVLVFCCHHRKLEGKGHGYCKSLCHDFTDFTHLSKPCQSHFYCGSTSMGSSVISVCTGAPPCPWQHPIHWAVVQEEDAHREDHAQLPHAASVRGKDLLCACLAVECLQRAVYILFLGWQRGQLMSGMETTRLLHSTWPVLILTCAHAHLQEENPKGEDVECLCKLLSTIGAPLDANPKSRDRMSAYFSRLARLAEHPKLESRHKFMVKVRTIAFRLSSSSIKPHVDVNSKCQAEHGSSRRLVRRYGC